MKFTGFDVEDVDARVAPLVQIKGIGLSKLRL
jgi:hypothetical protein